MQNPFKFYQYEDNAYIYDTNQKRVFQMGVDESADVDEGLEKTILNEGEEISKERAWEICGLDKLQPC